MQLSKYVSFLLFLAILAFHVCTLNRYPPPFADEPVYVARASGLLTLGVPFGTLDDTPLATQERSWATFPLLPTALHAPAVALFGADDYRGPRCVSLLFGALLLVSVYAIGSFFGGPALGRGAMLFTGLSEIFAFSAHVVRTDILAAACAYGALAVYLRTEPAKLLRGMFSGLLVGLAFECHVRGIVVAPAMVLYELLATKRFFPASRRFWGFAAGGIISVLVYLAIHVFPDPKSYFGFATSAYAASRTPSLGLATLWSNLLEIVGGVRKGQGLETLLIFCGVALELARSKSRNLWLLLAVVGCVIASGVVLVRSPLFINLIMLSPAFDLLAGICAAAAFREGANSAGLLRRLPQIAIAVILLVAYARPTLQEMSASAACHDDLPVNRKFVSDYIPAGARVFGPAIYWPLIDSTEEDRNLYNIWEAIPAYRHVTGANLQESFQHLCPDYFIRDAQIDHFVADGVSDDAWYEDLRLGKTEFLQLLQSAELVGARNTRCVGRLRIYRFTRRAADSQDCFSKRLFPPAK